MACKYSGMLDELLNRPTGDLWLFGSDGNDDDDSGRDDDDDTGDEDDEDEDDDDADGDDGDKSKKSRSSKKKPKSAAEIAAMERRIANFDEERDRDKAKLKKANDSIKEKDAEISRLKSEGVKDEDVKKANIELTSENARLQTQVQQLLITNAFLGDKTRKWVDPSAAAKLLDTSNVEIDEKGKVTGLKTAIDELAERSTYLLVQEKSKDDDDADNDADNDQQERSTRRTGDQPGTRRKGGPRGQQAKDDNLRQRFSGLRK